MPPNKRAELVEKSLALFYRNGFHATGMDLVARETGVSKTSIYKHFRTKDELILAVLRLRDENFRNWLWRRAAERAEQPAAQLLAIFDALGEWFAQPGFQGCMFIKAAAEFQQEDHPVNVQAMEHKRLLEAHMADLARQAGLTDPAGLARQLLILKEGAIVLAAMSHDPAPAAQARRVAAQLLDSAGATPGGFAAAGGRC